MSLAVNRAGKLKGGPAHALLPLKLAAIIHQRVPCHYTSTSRRHLANAQTSPTDFDMYTFVYIAVIRQDFGFSRRVVTRLVTTAAPQLLRELMAHKSVLFWYCSCDGRTKPRIGSVGSPEDGWELRQPDTCRDRDATRSVFSLTRRGLRFLIYEKKWHNFYVLRFVAAPIMTHSILDVTRICYSVVILCYFL